jgi:hypothetical protein
MERNQQIEEAEPQVMKIDLGNEELEKMSMCKKSGVIYEYYREQDAQELL